MGGTLLDGPMLAFDLETTGVSPHRDRIVTAAVLHIHAQTDPAARRVVDERTWLVNPGIPIPTCASDIHGITDDIAAAGGQQPVTAVREIAEQILDATSRGCPVVGMNVTYDLTMLWAELLRNDHHGLADPVANVCPVVDVFVLDKTVDKYRKGSRKLIDIAKHYGITLSEQEAHGAAADALAAARVAWQIGAKWAGIGGIPLRELHAAQIAWKREQADSFGAYLRKQGKTDDVAREWPIQAPPAGWSPEQLPAREEAVA